MPHLLTTAACLLLAAGTATATAEPLPLDALVVAAPGGLAPSPRALALAGQRVRLVGHMARMEDPPPGAFYLATRPLRCDEGGAGIGDLPPDAVRVEVRSAAGATVRWLEGPLEVTGRLEVGPAEDAEGRVSWFRLILDRPEDLAAAPNPSSQPAGAPPRCLRGGPR